MPERLYYVPMVGKVTVAMLERNLMRLFDQFHHPDRTQKKPAGEQQPALRPIQPPPPPGNREMF